MRVPWAQDSIDLQANTEYVYQISSPCNVVMVRNHDDSNYIYMGNESVSSSKYDSLAIPKSWGSIGQPTQMHKIHLFTTTDISNVKIYLILSESPTAFMGNMMRAVEGIVEVSATPGLKAGELNIDEDKNLAVKVVNFDEIEINLDAGELAIGDVTVTSSPDLKASELNLDASKNLGVNIINSPTVAVSNSGFDVEIQNFEDFPGLVADDLNIDVSKNIGVVVKNVADFPTGGEGGGGGSNPKLTPVIVNLALSSINTEYSTVLPVGTKKFMVGLRTNDEDYRLAFTAGKVAAPTSPYLTCPAGFTYTEENLLLEDTLTIYIACGVTGKHAQIVYWV